MTVMDRRARLEWGAEENAARIADIVLVGQSAMTATEANKRARIRGEKSGMPPRDVFRAVVEAQWAASGLRDTTAWRTMASWRSDGPPNGTEILLLLADGTRIVACFNGLCGRWVDKNDRPVDDVDRPTVAWAPIPDVPHALLDRRSECARRMKAIAEELTMPLSAEDLGAKSPSEER